MTLDEERRAVGLRADAWRKSWTKQPPSETSESLGKAINVTSSVGSNEDKKTEQKTNDSTCERYAPSLGFCPGKV